MLYHISIIEGRYVIIVTQVDKNDIFLSFSLISCNIKKTSRLKILFLMSFLITKSYPK